MNYVPTRGQWNDWLRIAAGIATKQRSWPLERWAKNDAKIYEAVGTAITGIGMFIGAIGALIVYFGVWIAAIDSAGWVIGVALGWIPGGIAALVTYFLFRYFWWVILIAVVVLLR